VAYLYNGVRLPALPEVEGYSYAIIYYDEFSKTYAMELYENISYGYYQFNDGPYWSVYSIGRYWWYDYDPKTNSWSLYEAGMTESLEYMFSLKTDFLWANFDVLNEDGTIHFSASAPIPVYE
jgi:hypothetical protein